MSADSPAQPAAMRTDLSSSAGAMARGAARGALGALLASVLALGFQAIVRHIVDIETMGLFTLATTVVVLAQLPALFGLEAGAHEPALGELILAGGIPAERRLDAARDTTPAYGTVPHEACTLAR